MGYGGPDIGADMWAFRLGVGDTLLTEAPRAPRDRLAAGEALTEAGRAGRAGRGRLGREGGVQRAGLLCFRCV